MMEGLKGGILSKAADIAESAVSVVKNAINAAKEALGIRSPSRVFAEIGRYTDEGFIKGLNSLSNNVSDASKDMANSAIDGAKSIVTNIGALSTDGMELHPTVRPVFDMSDVKLTRLEIGTNIDAIIGRPVNYLSQIVSDAQSSINTSNREVIEAINGLREDLNAIYESSDQEVALYVDSKKLATSLAKPMNRQLNILSKRGAY